MSIVVASFVVFIILASFVFGGLAIKWHNDHEIRKERIRAGGEGNTLGTSELRGLIQEAMTDAVAPIEERLDLLESHMRQLPERSAGSAEAQQERSRER